jgi:hypothetical protein
MADIGEKVAPCEAVHSLEEVWPKKEIWNVYF